MEGKLVMSRTIDFIFDFASPNGYFALHGLKGVAERTGATVNLHTRRASAGRLATRKT